jgi:hypothetical protein
LTAASIDGLAGRAELVVEHVKSLPPDDQALARATALKAEIVVEVTWPSGDDARAHLHAHLRRTSPWVDRDLGFATTAPAWERGRAVGLAIAAMVPDDEPPTPTPTPTPAPTAPTAPTSAPPAARPPRAPRVRDVGPDERTPPPTPRNGRPHVAIGALGELAPSSGGEGFGGGARVDGTWSLTPLLAARASAGARFDPFPDARAHVSSVVAGGGLALRLFGLADGSSLVVRADLLAAYISVLRDRRDGGAERHGRFVPTTALFAEGSLALASLSPHASLVVALGVEVALGTTTIEVAGDSTFALPRTRPLGQLGFRWAF